MQNSSKLTEPSDKVIDEISNNLILAVTEANRGKSRLRCKSLAHPDPSDGMQLAEQIRALQLAQVVIKRGLDRRIADARRRQNALRPVNQLPAEVLSTIFHQLLSNVPVFDHFKFLFIVAGVSTRWKSVIDSTPSLWSFVSSNNPTVHVDRALQKSGRTAISVACRYPGDFLTATSKQGSRDFLQRMQSTGRQWDGLALHLPTISHLREFLETPLPHLRKLDINVAYPSSNPVDLFGGERGFLENVRIRRAYLEWDSEAFSRLHELQLDYREAIGISPSLTQILRLLHQSPGLRCFSWSGLIDDDMADTRVTRTTTLSRLTRLSLKDVSEFSAFKILESIRAPSCGHFTVHCEALDGDTDLLSQLQYFLPSLKSSLQRAATISICLGPSNFHYHCVPQTPDCSSKLDFKFERTDPSSVLEWFAEQLHEFGLMTSPIKIPFDPRFDFTRNDNILPALFRLRNVVSLTVADRIVGPCRLLKWLSRPIRSQGNSASWPFPNLWEMELGQSNLLIQDVFTFFHTRYSLDRSRDLRGRPVWLQRLRLIGREWQDKSAEQALKRILLGTEYSLKISCWLHAPCKVNEDSLGIGDEESRLYSHESDESSIVDSETTSETDDSGTSEDSEDETGEE